MGSCVSAQRVHKKSEDPVPPKFPFYKLPLDIQEHIVEFMDEYEIIQGSLVSPNFRLAVRQAKIKLAHLWIVQTLKFETFDAVLFRRLFRKPPPAILFFPDSDEDYHYSINFFWRKHKRQVDRLLRNASRVRISEDLWMVAIGRNIVIYNYNPEYSKLDAYQFILDVIFGTFLVDRFRIGDDWKHYSMPKDTMIHLVLRYRNFVRSIEVMQGTGRDASADLTSEDLSAILDNLEAPEIRLIWRTKPGAKYTGILKTKKMTLYRASWLTIDNLLAMECEEFEAGRTNFTALELGSLIRKWQEGGFEQLKTLNLQQEKSEIDWMLLLNEFQGVRVMWNFNHKLLRREDGRMATIRGDRSYLTINISTDINVLLPPEMHIMARNQ